MSNLVKVLRTGAKFPQVGLGTWQSAPGEVAGAVRAALDAGYRHIDCAAIYQNEAEIGEVFTDVFSGGKIKREDVFITSKLWNTKHSAADVRPALEKTLKDLKIDYLDLYLIHWPVSFDDSKEPGKPWVTGDDGLVIGKDAPHNETWAEMEKAVDDGLVKAIGLSNFNIDQIEAIISSARIKPSVLQVEVHPLNPQVELVEYCKKQDIVVTGYCPLGSGVNGLLQDPIVKELAAKYNKKESQVLIRYAIDRGVVSIPKSVNPGRIALNFDVEGFELSAEDVTKLNGLANGNRVCAVYQWRHLAEYPFASELETLAKHIAAREASK